MSAALDPLRQAMEECLYGPPTTTVVLRHAGKSSTVPTEIDVLIRAFDEDGKSWSYIGTIGQRHRQDRPNRPRCSAR